MHIFIDESGLFIPSANGPGVSLTGALIIPDGRMTKIANKYESLRRGLPKSGEEVKGRSLNERQTAAVIELLRRNETLLELVAIDLNIHAPDGINAHREGLAQAMTNGLTTAHNAQVHAWAHRLAASIRALNDQLYAQSVAMFELVRSASEHAINYFAQRRPEELRAFHWTIDAKDKTRRTNWEQLWADIVMPVLQSRSIQEPYGFFEEGDYRFFTRFERQAPEWIPRPEGASETVTDIRLLLMESFRFSASPEAGLELVDIVVNAARRALIGNLERSGWEGLPELMINLRERQCIRLIGLNAQQPPRTLGYEDVMRHFRTGGRQMLAPRFLAD